MLFPSAIDQYAGDEEIEIYNSRLFWSITLFIIGAAVLLDTLSSK